MGCGDAVTVRVLRYEKRAIGGCQQVDGSRHIGAEAGDAGAHRDGSLTPAFALDGAAHALGYEECAFFVRIRQQNGELLAAKARQQV